MRVLNRFRGYFRHFFNIIFFDDRIPSFLSVKKATIHRLNPVFAEFNS
jgi:hypothetical protein